MALVIQNEREEEKEGKKEERKTIYWMDPEDWGKYAWTVLFCLVPSSTASENDVEAWQSLMLGLPDVLPCITCRKCCQSYVRSKPPPGLQSTFVERCHWLLKLRHGIQQRNINKGNVTKTLAVEKGHYYYKEKDDAHITVYQYREVLKLRMLLLFNAFVFFICSSATMDNGRQKNASQWFLQCFNVFGIEKKKNKNETKAQTPVSIPTLIEQVGLEFGEAGALKGMLKEVFRIALPVHYN